MTSVQEIFLKLIKESLTQQENPNLFSGFEGWQELYEMCAKHSVSALVLPALTKHHESSVPPELLTNWKNSAVTSSLYQYARSNAFSEIYRNLAAECGDILVLKGEILREIYPDPTARTSLDEDVLIKKEALPLLREKLSALGFCEIENKGDDYHFVNKLNRVYIEAHTSLFPEEKAYDKWNAAFADPFGNKIKTENGFYALSRTDNLIFLLLHCAKHFVYSGIGMKQLVDIALFTDRYRNEIDFAQVEKALKKADCLEFGREIFNTVNEYILPVPSYGKADGELIEDILCAGSLGNDSKDRKTSAIITSQSFKSGGKKSILKKIFFPPKERLYEIMPKCEKNRLLLAAAYIKRIFLFFTKASAVRTLKTGNERLKLIKKYKLI